MHSALLGGSEQTALLRQAWAQGLADGRLVFLTYDTMLFALPYRNRSYPALGHSGPLRGVYDAVLSVTLESGPVDMVFKPSGAGGEVAARLEPEQVGQCGLSQGQRGARAGVQVLLPLQPSCLGQRLTGPTSPPPLWACDTPLI